MSLAQLQPQLVFLFFPEDGGTWGRELLSFYCPCLELSEHLLSMIEIISPQNSRSLVSLSSSLVGIINCRIRENVISCKNPLAPTPRWRGDKLLSDQTQVEPLSFIIPLLFQPFAVNVVSDISELYFQNFVLLLS